MLIRMQMKWLATMLTALCLTPAWARSDSTPDIFVVGAYDSMGNMSAMDPGMDHSGMNMKQDMQSKDLPVQGLGMDEMDHEGMKMQGGSPPSDARDPHMYSGGYTLDSGPYSLSGPRQLRMADEHNFGAVLLDRLERVNSSDSDYSTYDAQAWFGRDYDRVVIKAEGDIGEGKLKEASTELLWGHAIATFWDSQLGVRYDSGDGPDRSWLAFGVQGLAPYWFEVDATAYVGENGRTALGMEAEYELLITQKLILQPRLEANLYGKRDVEREIGSGLSDMTVGLRLRYEIKRQFAPYLGIEWAGKFGGTENYAKAAGKDPTDTRLVAGIRFWF